jgi:hypothetical protein
MYSQAYLNKAARQLNERQDLGIRKPQQRFNPVLRRPVELTVISGHLRRKKAGPLYPQ